MYFSDEIALISETYKEDSIGQQLPQETQKIVFCEIQGISSTETFEAGRNGLRASCRAIVFQCDYNGEEIVELNGKRYGIYRTYPRKNETIELYLSQKAGVL